MNDARLKSIVIVGGGTAGWMAAAALARTLDSAVGIRLIESEDIGTVGVGEATVPHLRAFNDTLRIDEVDFVRAVRGTFKLGIQFVDWGSLGSRYIHGFGTIGHEYRGLPFHQYWLKLHSQGKAQELGEYSLNTAAAPRGRFMTGASDVPPTSPLSRIAYAYHFDAGLYAQYLRRYAEARRVARIEGEIVDVKLRGTDGFIESVTLKSGQAIAGDLFIDCSGFRGLLIEQALRSGYDDWTRWLPCDRAVAVPSEKTAVATPYTRSTARAAGWQWRIPLQHRTGNGHVYSSAHLADDQAAATLLGHLDGRPLAEPRVLRFSTGRRRQVWSRNCVALGLASGFLEPLESTSIYLIQSGIARLIQMLPDRHMSPVLQARYNAEAQFEMERIRDFLILHYHVTQRRDSEFWKYCAHMPVPEPLADTIRLFQDSGRFFRNADEMFALTSWVQVMIGQHLLPAAWHPLVDAVPDNELAQLGESVRSVVSSCVAAMPEHEQFLSRCCQAPAAA
ncbi:MAG TPA: tryptophan halogenase family protein [Steroidobacteraceae bacterium]|nr:tryptophan halogenase family protein [Steroidobacteraceae bacterium]